MSLGIGKFLEVIDIALDSAVLFSIIPKLMGRFSKPSVKAQETAETGVNNAADAAATVAESRDNIFSKKDDKMRLMAHLTYPLYMGQVNFAELSEFNKFLANATVKERSAFRDAFLTHDTWKAKQWVIVSMMKMKTDEDRRTFLTAVGLNDPTLLDELRKDLKEPYNALLIWACDGLAELEDNKLKRIEKKKAQKETREKGLIYFPFRVGRNLIDALGLNIFR